ncbi:GNAT family N-acetyltransferase [Roseibium sp.]|uniref:GNAT family N-acetyltransferase n=1 Tax=Roseibium sp. TaxID=1936156 RepID=UPI003A9729E7
MPLKIRAAHPGDTNALTDIMHRAKASWGYDDAALAGFRNAFRITQGCLNRLDMLVAELDGKPVGFAGGKLEGAGPDAPYLIDYLFVAPEEGRKGIGRLLLTRLSDQARFRGATRLRLESDHFARGFYETLGYTVTGTRPSQMAPDRVLPIMEKALGSGIEPLKSLEIRLDAGTPWDFETVNRADIDAYWHQLITANPHLWNGRTLKLTGYSFQDGTLTGTCRECSYAAFLAWRDWGAPDITTFNLFGSAVVRSSDGAILYGVMAPHTATAGKIYPAGGNLDLGDVGEDGTIDVEGSILRELKEETGITPSAGAGGSLHAIFDGPRISIARVIDVDRPADRLRETMIEHSLASDEMELADIHIIRGADDLTNPDIMPYARRFARYLLDL